jgi:inner membrane transporter RhtA
MGMTAPPRKAARSRVGRRIETSPPETYFLVSATFHYLGPSFAVLLFARVGVLGVAWLRIASAAVIFALWRRPWRRLRDIDRDARKLLVLWGVTLAAMNACFYTAISRLPLATVSAIEFLPVIALAALGARTARNVIALALAIPGVYLLTQVKLGGSTFGFVFAFANALLFSVYIVLADRVAKRPQLSGIDGLGAAMLIAAVVVTPIGGWQALPAFTAPTALLAGIGVGISSSVIPYVTDQLAMARLPRATYATMVALLPAIATIIGVIVLTQIPTRIEIAGIALVIAGVALHRQQADQLTREPSARSRGDAIGARGVNPGQRNDRRARIQVRSDQFDRRRHHRNHRNHRANQAACAERRDRGRTRRRARPRVRRRR